MKRLRNFRVPLACVVLLAMLFLASQLDGRAHIDAAGPIDFEPASSGFVEPPATPPASEIEQDDDFPSEMPATPYPEIKGCSSGQVANLKKAWRLAHYYTWRADRLLDHILSQSESERQELWDRDFAADEYSPSPRRWFGPYNRERAATVREAMDKARKRFEMKGGVVDGVRVLRCGQPIAPAIDKDTDVCPGGNPSSDGPPSAYHAPVGTVVTCPSFWDRLGDQSVDADTRLTNAAKTLVHEMFHWLSAGGKYVTDYHTDGLKGEKNDKYYGAVKATYLAEHKQSWAIYNNDNYAWFAYSVGNAEPSFSAVWGPKEPGGTGVFLVDLTWEGLVEKWRSLGDTQYLADVETYVKDGVRRYIAVCRFGKGNGALYASDWTGFAKKYQELKKTQDLIDVEIYKTGDSWTHLGVYRAKQGATGDGGLLAGLSWEQLGEKWKEFANVAYLADVETYVEEGKRKYIAVWRAGKGNGALFRSTDRGQFEKFKQDLNKTQELIDFEKFLSLDGKWYYLGVWRQGKPSEVLHSMLPRSDLFAKWGAYKSDRTLLDVEEYTPLPVRIK